MGSVNANVCKEMTLRDVAKAAGVSMATVSRSLNDSTLIPETTRKRVRGIADQLGFEFNSHARSLITRRVGTIGIILPPDFDRFGVNLYHGTLHNSLRSVLECNDIDLIDVCVPNVLHHDLVIAAANAGWSFRRSFRTLARSPTICAWSARCTPGTTTTPKRW